MIEIRNFEPKDATTVCNLIRINDLEIASQSYPKGVITYWDKDLTPDKILEKSRQRICFVAEQDKKVVGYISFLEREIKKLFVLPELHRRGIGRELISKIDEVAKEKSLDKLIVYSTIYGEPFYQSCGFNKIRDSWQETGNKIKYKLIYMEKKLK